MLHLAANFLAALAKRLQRYDVFSNFQIFIELFLSFYYLVVLSKTCYLLFVELWAAYFRKATAKIRQLFELPNFYYFIFKVFIIFIFKLFCLLLSKNFVCCPTSVRRLQRYDKFLKFQILFELFSIYFWSCETVAALACRWTLYLFVFSYCPFFEGDSKGTTSFCICKFLTFYFVFY